MRWIEKGLWKAGIAITGILFLLVLMVWLPVSVADAHGGASGFARPGIVTVQTTPTVDLTVVVQDQLKQQDDKLQRENSIPWAILNAVGGSIGTILVGAAALIAARLGSRQWFGNREEERRKRAEERFQAVIVGLGSEREEAKVGAAIMLRTFLQKGYEQFYLQAFDLAVAHLRLQMPLTTLSQALIVVFKEAFLLARSQINIENPESLDASRIQLDNAFLWAADLKGAWMPESFLRKANLYGAVLTGAFLRDADLTWANLKTAKLSGTNLRRAKLTGADLNGADLTGADLTGADLTEAKLNATRIHTTWFRGDRYELEPREEDVKAADLREANLSGADLREANLSGVDFRGAILLDAKLEGAILQGAIYNTKVIHERDAQGRLVITKPTQWGGFDPNSEPSMIPDPISGPSQSTVSRVLRDIWNKVKQLAPTIRSSQPPVSMSLPSQSNDLQAQSAPSAQGSIKTPNTGGGSAPSSKRDPEL